MQVSHPDDAEDYFALVGPIRPGSRTNLVLATGTEDAPDNYRVAFTRGVEGDEWSTPRHHHNFEQIRYVLEGEYPVTKSDVIPAGGIGYVSAGVFYGPQVQRSSMSMLLLQFGAMSGDGYISVDQRRRGREQLLARGGTFRNGVYSRLDPDGHRYQADAFEAVWEEVMGRRVDYPQPRYSDLVIMNPDNFGWMADPRLAGVERKWLGTFTEGEVRVGFVRAAAEAAFELGAQPAVEVLFVTAGEVRTDTRPGEVFGRYTSFTTSAQEQPVRFTASTDVECFYAKLPTFPSEAT